MLSLLRKLSRHIRRIVAAALLLCVAVCGRAAFADEYDPYRETLRQAGIATDPSALRDFLLSQIPDAASHQRAAELVKLLGSESFRDREQAQLKLAGMANPPQELLHAAAKSDDPEMRYRAKHLLATIGQGTNRATVNAVLGHIAQAEVKGLAPAILQYAPHAGNASAQGSLARALLASAAADDADLLRKAIADSPVPIAALAVTALAKTQQEAVTGELQELLQHKHEQIRLASAAALANLGKRSALEALIRLLESESQDVRLRSAALLRNFTGRSFRFAAYESVESRAEAVARWRSWLAERGSTAVLHFPLDAAPPFLGRTLISMYPSRLREIDSQGTVMMETDGYEYIWGCHATADGQRVVVDYKKKQLTEYDNSGQQLLRLESLPGTPSDVRRLPNGRFLLALANENKIAEIDRSGVVSWSLDLEGRPTTVNRLPNGNTLVNLQFAKKVVEVDPGGNIVWEKRGLNNVLTAQALPGGNVLVCEMGQGKAVEYDRSGKVVWSKDGFRNACQAQRLPSGNTLVSDSHGLHEINPEGKEVWSLEVPRGRFWRY